MSIVSEDIERIVATDLPWQDLVGARVLISGAAGFLAAYMVETCLKVGANVTVLGRQSVIDRWKWRQCEILAQDVCEPVWTQCGPIRYRRTFDYVIHAASPASPKLFATNPIETILANTRGTENMLNACSGKFLYFSSGEAANLPDTEEIRSCYGESKRMGEMMCLAWWQQRHGLDTKVARISHTYGPGMKLDDGRVFADFTRDIINGGPIVLNSPGLAKRPFLYLADATIAFFTILLKGESGIYNVANPNEFVMVGRLAHRLGEEFHMRVEHKIPSMGDIFSGPSPDTPGLHSPLPPVEICPDITRLRALGWEPTTTIEEGFRRTVRSYDDSPS